MLVVAVACNYFLYAQPKQNQSLSFLHTAGQDIVNQSGTKIYLKGVGLGNWLLPEGYMWKFGGAGDRPRKIEKVVADLIGTDKAAQFWKTFRKNYITEADIKQIALLGFNSVRPALNARLFLTEAVDPVYVEEGFQLMDSLVTWCKKYKLYVILDMHGAPGGQTGANIDDSKNDIPELFIEKKYQDQLVDLWVKLAQKYKDEPAVAAYDLLNEPLPIGTGAAEKYKHLLEPLYRRITAAIRKVDQKHMITVEGFNWANDWSVFSKPFDSNMFYQFHYYCWGRPDNLNGIDQYLKKRDELNAPVWVGETGEKNNAIYWATSQYFAAHNIGFSFWPWKKMDTKNTPYSINAPANWDLIAGYTNGAAKPEAAVAEKIFNELLENIKITNCVYFEEVCNAVLTKVPAKIEAENYGHNGYLHSYYVTDTATKSAYYRRNEPVQIKLDSKNETQLSSEQSVELNTAEWVSYNFECDDTKKYELVIRASAAAPATIEIVINRKKKVVKITSAVWNEMMAGMHQLKKGSNTVQIKVVAGKVQLDWFALKNKRLK
jgi:hypothetical protein